MKCPARPLLAALLLGLGVAQAEEKVLRLYNWAGYFAPDTLAAFIRETGIHVVYDVMDSSETLEAKLMSGNSGCDLTFPDDTVAERLMRAGVLQKLSPRRLEHLDEIEPGLREPQAHYARSCDAAVSCTWGTIGLTPNCEQIERHLIDAPLDSLDLLFKPELAARFTNCGISLVGSPDKVLALALHYLGRGPHSGKPQDLIAALALLQHTKPYTRRFQPQPVAQLVNEEICLSLGYSGDAIQAQRATDEAGKALRFVYRVPCEGTSLWTDSMAIPVDMQHPEYAYALINFTMRSQNTAAISSATGYPTSSAGTRALVSADMRDNPDIYPDATTYARLFPGQDIPQRDMRAWMRAWTIFKTTRSDPTPEDPK